MTLLRPATDGPQIPRLSEPRALRAMQPDAFIRAVPDADFDICLLFHQTRCTQAIDRFQLLLRGMCALDRQVTRAAMMEDRIEVQIDAAKVILGNMEQVQALRLCRPDIAGASRQSGRLAYLLAHHDLALRLRIDTNASGTLITEICHLAMGPHPPKAVILLKQRLLLSPSEFRARDPAALHSLPAGAQIETIRARYARPARLDADQPPSPFAPQVQRPQRPKQRHIVFAPSNTKATASIPQDDPLDQIVSDFCDGRQLAALVAGFRTPPVKATLRNNQRAEWRYGKPAPRQNAAHCLLCDAVRIEFRGHVIKPLAPILLATLVLFTQLNVHFHHATPNASGDAVVSGAASQTPYSA